jgi:O-antigen biosynthesis protein
MQSQILTIIKRADTAYQRGLCDSAVDQLLSAVRANPREGDLYLKLAEIFVDSERYGDALNILAQMPSAHMVGHALCLMGFCREALDDNAAAETAVERAIRLNIDSALAHTLKGHMAARCGNYVSAEGHYRKALSCDDGCGLAYLMLGMLKWEQGNRPAAMNDFEDAFTREPTDRRIAIRYHSTAVALTEFDRAIASFRAALMQRRHNRRLAFLLIDLLLRKGDLEGAMGQIEAAMAEFGIDDGMLAAALAVRERLEAQPRVEKADKGCRVSLCMIVKNEEKHLARCLHSSKPVVDEMVVVDTGSTDRSKDIATAFGAHVHEFPWVDDFSTARNFSLSKASGGWIFVLDADEVISPQDHAEFRRIVAASKCVPVAYSIRTRNYTHRSNTLGWRPNKGDYAEEDGAGWFPSDKVRLFINDRRIQFANPVHELVEPSLIRLKILVGNCSIPVHHYGKLEEEKTFEKTKAYKNLGRKKLGNNRHSPSAIREQAIQCAHLGKHAEALRLWKEFVKLQPKSAEAYVNIGTACWSLARYSEAVSYAHKALCFDPALKEARFNKGIGLLLMGKAAEARSVLQRLLEQEPDYPAAEFMLCVAGACMGEIQHVEHAISKLRETPLGMYLGESFLDIAQRLFAARHFDYARRTLEAAQSMNYSSDAIMALLEGCRAAA